MKTFCLSAFAALAFTSSVSAAVFQFNSVTTYSQEAAATVSLTVGLVTHVQATLPMSVDLANVNEATSFRIGASAMWSGDDFTVLLGQDPKYRAGATKASINTPSGNILLSWTATSLTFSGVLIDNHMAPVFFPGPAQTPIPLGIQGPFRNTNAIISVHFQYNDYTHLATLTGTNKVVTYASVIAWPFPPYLMTNYVSVNAGKYSVIADMTAPTINFNSPKQNTVVTSDNIDVNLTVSDNVSLGVGPLWLGSGSTLGYTVNGGSFYSDADTFPGMTSTTHTLNLSGSIHPGTNVITFVTVDSSGNFGSNTLTLFYSEQWPIFLATNGVGGITGVTNGQNLLVGRNYTVTAKPGPGKVLTAWQDGYGNVVSRSSVFTFKMAEGLALTASFADNPFSGSQGNYLGYFQPSFTPNASQFGGVKLNLTASGSFSGTLTSGAGSQSFSGQFLYNSNGVQDASIVVKSATATNSLNLLLTTDTGSSNYGLIQGYLYFGPNGVKIVQRTSASFANLTAAMQTNATTISGPGMFHFSVNATTNPGDFPTGIGFGTLNVAVDGTVTGSLTLADGDAPTSTFSSHLVYHNGYVPIFVPLYNKGGGFLMTLNMGTVATDGTAQDVATATWVKPAGKPFYANGFATENEINVARFTSVFKNAPNGVIGIELDSAGILLGPSVAMVNGAFAPTSTADGNPKGTISSAGNMTGTFVDGGITRTFKGLVISSTANNVEAFGFFVHSTQTGSVVLDLSAP